MKKQLLIFTLVAFAFGACSSSEKPPKKSEELSTTEVVTAKAFTTSSNIDGFKKVTGSLNYSGSEPFVTPTIFISDSSSFKLSADTTFIKETYPAMNGERASLYGKVIEKDNLVYFEVHFYEVIKD